MLLLSNNQKKVEEWWKFLNIFSCRVVLHVKDGALKLQSDMIVVVVDFIFFFIVVVFVVGSCCMLIQLLSRKYWFYCHGKLERVLILFGRDYICFTVFFSSAVPQFYGFAQILLMGRLHKPFSDGKTMHFQVVIRNVNDTLWLYFIKWLILYSLVRFLFDFCIDRRMLMLRSLLNLMYKFPKTEVTHHF